MNEFLSQILPSAIWLKLHITMAWIAALALFYILEQLVVYGGGPFSNIVIAVYRTSLALTITGLFMDVVELMATGDYVRPLTTIALTGFACIAVVVAVTHKRYDHFRS